MKTRRRVIIIAKDREKKRREFSEMKFPLGLKRYYYPKWAEVYSYNRIGIYSRSLSEDIAVIWLRRSISSVVTKNHCLTFYVSHARLAYYYGGTIV